MDIGPNGKALFGPIFFPEKDEKKEGNLSMKTMRSLVLLLLALAVFLGGCAWNPLAQPPVSATPTDTVESNGPATDPETEPETDPPLITEDPYTEVDREAFYANYTPAVSAEDAYYRTLHGLLSGSIEEQDQSPTLSTVRPMENGLYLRNSDTLYSEDGDTYYVMNAMGEVVNRIYREGAYVTLEEVAAYLFAFGDVPPNYLEKKSGNPRESVWGEYLRVNHSYFSGDTSRYPYEPKLPDIRGCGGALYYYEVDIGTTGTDCDPRYPSEPYNDGYSITRGAARIVYTRYDANQNEIIDPNEKFVFYTYNHYNDFCEYLNYEGGWGETFGNITGGGAISSKQDYNPTPYVKTVLRSFTQMRGEAASVTVTVCPLVLFAFTRERSSALAA